MRSLLREDALAEAVEEEGGAAIEAAAARRVHEVADQRCRQRRLEQHRHLAGPDLARAEAGQRTLRGARADRLGRSKRQRVAGNLVPVVPLHGVVAAGDQRARQVVA
jgi:hypothetical protein